MKKVDYAPLLNEVRELLKGLRENSGLERGPTGPAGIGLRTWANHVQKTAKYPVNFRHVRRFETGESTNSLDAGYVIACAIASNTEIVLGANPRVVRHDLDEKARDFMRALRLAAATGDAPISPQDVERLKDEIGHTLGPKGKLKAM